MRYDADENPDPKAWLPLDESKRIDLVIDFHRRNHLTLSGSDKLHGAVHMIVENQFALGDATVMIFDAVTKKDDKNEDGGDINAKYGRELAALPSRPRPCWNSSAAFCATTSKRALDSPEEVEAFDAASEKLRVAVGAVIGEAD